MHSFGAVNRVVVLPSPRHYRAGAYKISYAYVSKILKYYFVDRFIALPYVLPNPLAAVKFSGLSRAVFAPIGYFKFCRSVTTARYSALAPRHIARCICAINLAAPPRVLFCSAIADEICTR